MCKPIFILIKTNKGYEFEAFLELFGLSAICGLVVELLGSPYEGQVVARINEENFSNEILTKIEEIKNKKYIKSLYVIEKITTLETFLNQVSSSNYRFNEDTKVYIMKSPRSIKHSIKEELKKFFKNVYDIRGKINLEKNSVLIYPLGRKFIGLTIVK